MIHTAAENDQGRDNREVPRDGGNVGKKEFAMTVQYAQTPGGQHEQSRARKENLNQSNREGASGGIKTICKQIDEVWSRQNSNEHDHRRHEHQQREDSIRDASCFFFVTAREELRIDRNERSRKCALAKDILQKIRNSKCGTERACSIGRAQV